MTERIYNTGGTQARSVRVPDKVWFGARDRAEDEDTSISHVIRTLLTAYGNGTLNLPTVTMTFEDPTGT